MICINEEDSWIHGDYNADETRMIQVRLNRCSGEDCEDEETINNFFRSTLVGILTNRIRFDPEFFGPESIILESQIMWNSISTQVQQEVVYKIDRTELSL